MRNRPPLPDAGSCLFLDVDGTLIEFSDTPSRTRATPELRELLGKAAQKVGGALALISGRPLAELDRIFSPSKFPAAGLHGGQRRAAHDSSQNPLINDYRLDPVRARFATLKARHPGVEVEDKLNSVAIHFRLNPTAEAVIASVLPSLLEEIGSDYHALEGSMVFEIKPRAFTKGQAIEAFLREPPFASRQPIFIGDDVTDIDALRCVESYDGISIAVGDRVDAQWRLPDPAAVRDWLGEFVAPDAQRI